MIDAAGVAAVGIGTAAWAARRFVATTDECRERISAKQQQVAGAGVRVAAEVGNMHSSTNSDSICFGDWRVQRTDK